MKRNIKSIRASNGVPRQSRIDQTTIESMQFVKDTFKKSLSIYPSNSVIIRRAVEVYTNTLKKNVPDSWEGSVNYALLSELNCLLQVSESIYDTPDFDLKIPVGD